jgi:hypothetical protein
MRLRFSLIVGLVFLGACNGGGSSGNVPSDPNPGQQNNQVGTGAGGGTGTEPVGTSDGEKCYKQTFHEPSSAPDKLDVLFVTNTREQESFLREDLAWNWFSYEFSLPRHSDFRVAVMLGGGSDSGLSGRLWHHWGEPAVLHQHPYSCDWDVTDGLIADFWNLPLECRNDQGEEEFYSLTQGVTSPHRSEWSEREGFFRRDAMLAVVFVSDVPDACFQSDQKWRADCDGFSVKGLFESLRAFKGGMPVIYEGVVHNDRRGAGFTDLIHLGKGLVVDPDSCEGPADIMRKLGSFAGKTAFTFPTGFPLAMDSLDPAAFQVWVDQNPTTDFTYDPTDNTIFVPSAAHAGADVTVQYCVEQSGASPSPVPSSSITPTPSPSVTSSATPTPTPSPTVTPTPSPTVSASPSSTPTPSPTPSSTDSGSPTPTPSPSDSGCVGPLCGSGPIGV